MNIQSDGFDLFRLSVELDMVPLATSILQKLLNEKHNNHMERFFATSEVKYANPLAKESVFKALSQKESAQLGQPGSAFGSGELILALLFFNSESKGTKYYLFFERIERSVVKIVASLKTGEICGILRSYAVVGRLYPPMMAEIDKRLDGMVEDLKPSIVLEVLWSLARLNHRDGQYLPRLVHRFLEHNSTIKANKAEGKN